MSEGLFELAPVASFERGEKVLVLTVWDQLLPATVVNGHRVLDGFPAVEVAFDGVPDFRRLVLVTSVQRHVVGRPGN